MSINAKFSQAWDQIEAAINSRIMPDDRHAQNVLHKFGIHLEHHTCCRSNGRQASPGLIYHTVSYNGRQCECEESDDSSNNTAEQMHLSLRSAGYGPHLT